MNLSGFSIRRPVAVAMIVLGILILGFVSLEKIPINLLPDITYPKITLRTEYPHAAPREVEERVTKYIESVVGIISNVVKVSSVSRPGWSDVYVEFKWGSDIDVITMDIREKVQLVEPMLPEEVESPLLLRYDPKEDPIITLAVTGDEDLSDLRRWVEVNLELGLERLDGVAAVKIEGGYEDEVLVEMDQEKLARFKLRISQVAERLRRENVNIAGGSLEEAGAKLTVRTVNRFETLEDIEKVVVAEPQAGEEEQVSAASMDAGAFSGMSSMLGSIASLPSGSMPGLQAPMGTRAGAGTKAKASAVIRVKDIANVSYSHKERTEIARLAGRECIKVSVFKEGDANIVSVANDVHDAVDEIRQVNRVEPRTEEWTRRLRSPVRKLKALINKLSKLLLAYRPFVIQEEPVPLENDIRIETVSDQAVFINQAIYSVAQTAIWGSIFAVLVLYLFLRNWSSTLIVGLAIPVSIITTFNLMYFLDISFNIMSLGGLALVVGMLVDNSIVVLENILRRRSFEPEPSISAERGAGEVSAAITASTITNIMVFLPIVFLEGMFREIFGDLAWTVTMGLICSEAVALSLVPMMTVVLGRRVHLPEEVLKEIDRLSGKGDSGEREREGGDREEAGKRPAPEDGGRGPGKNMLRYSGFREFRERELLDRGGKPGRAFQAITLLSFMVWWPVLVQVLLVKRAARAFSRSAGTASRYPLGAFDRGFARVRAWYPGFLSGLLKRHYLVSGAAITVATCSLYLVYLLGWELIPEVDQGEFRVKLEFPAGTPIEETNKRIAAMEKKIRDIPLSGNITSIFATVGMGTAEGESETEKAENIGEIHVSLKDRDQRDVSDQAVMGQAMQALQNEVGVVPRSDKPQLLSYKAPIQIEIEGTNLDTLRAVSEDIIDRISGIQGLSEIESSLAESSPEVNIIIDRTRASALGLSVSEITDAVRRKVKGEVPTMFENKDEQIDIRVALKEEDRADIGKLKKLLIQAPAGDVRLSQVASITPALGPASINRSENSRVALVHAANHGRPLGDVVRDITDRLSALELPSGFHWEISGQNEEMKRSLPSLYLAGILAIALVYIVLAAQFESLLHPFVIMFCVPFSLVGLSLILLATGQTINIFSIIGMLMMVGIAVNDAIVLVSTINLRRDEGMERTQAIVEAGSSRLRPILITTLTTCLGMVPMAIALGPGSELRAPMAITVIGGLLSSTMFTLTAIPCIYMVLDRILPRAYKPRPAPGTGTSAGVDDASGGAKKEPGEE